MTNRREFLGAGAALFASCLPGRAGGGPKQILLMRHAEKSANAKDPNLNARGYARAAALARLFPARFDTPDFLFATKASQRSNRPVETIAPLARALHLPIDARFADEKFASLARDLSSHSRYSGKTVLVCWHHGNIPRLAAALGVASPPSTWPEAQFDRIWRIRYLDGGATLEDLPQHLLDGDS
jgi:phosphohistidine phosphatase SixA